jgi:hypothetical protein
LGGFPKTLDDFLKPLRYFFKRPGDFYKTYFMYYFLYYFQSILGGMSHNVPAVCDGLAARIGKCVAFPGPTNCGWSVAWEWSEAK